MSANKLINAVIALVEDRSEAAKEMLRSPEMRLSSTEVQVRLEKALREREAKAVTEAMKSVLRVSLRADPGDTLSGTEVEAFYQGVTFVEHLLEEYVEHLLEEYIEGFTP